MLEKRRKKLGEVLLSQGIITEKQFMHALYEHKRTGYNLAVLLVQLGYVKQEDLNSILGEQLQLRQKKRIGEVLIEHGLISDQQLQTGLVEQKRSGKQLGKCLVSLGFISEQKLIEVLSAQLDIQHVVLDNFTFSQILLNEIPEEMARKYKVIPLFERDGILTIAMTDPTNLRTIDHLKFKTGKDIDPVIASEKSILTAIDKNYVSGMQEMNNMLKDAKSLDDLDVVNHKNSEEQESLTDEEGAQVVKIVNLIIIQAVNEGASDIHIEPMERYYRIRYRVDGELIEKNPIPLQFSTQIVSRLKILGGMDIAERRKPQDGHFQVRHQSRQVDLRVSTYPAMSRSRGVSEKVVLRIIDQEARVLTLDQLGFLPQMLAKFDELIKTSDGIILVTGPTGSGKTSTLYAALQRVSQFYSNKKNIITMEDPIEAHIEGVNQGQINPKAGFSFASGLRSILRQDPDIIMVGEMRDVETCQMAIQAALTGHLVFSTIHTNDSASTFTRLFDMGVESYLISSTIRGILAQRLVRKICENCREEYMPEQSLLQRTGLNPSVKLFRGKGCRFCNNTGYRGRMGIFELLIPDNTMERMIVQRASADQIKQFCLKNQEFDSLRRDGLRKTLQGTTTLEQVLSATQND